MRLLALVLFCTFSTATVAGAIKSRADAVAMVDAVVTAYATDGAEKTFKAISDKSVAKFHDRDLYPFVYNTNGICVAHGARPALIGKNLYDLKDQNGKYLIREMIDRSRTGAGWVNYKWPNPITNAIDDKTTYFTKLGDDYVVGVGIYGVSK